MDTPEQNPEAAPIPFTPPVKEHASVPVAHKEPEIKKRKRNFKKSASLIRTWIFTVAIILAALALSRLVILEILDKSYKIQAFRLPASFEESGYNGITTAYRFLDRVNDISKKGNYSRSVKEIEQYNQTAEQNELKVEISGIGISPEAIAVFIKKALGIHSRSIGGDIVQDGNSLKLFLRFTDSPTKILSQTIDSTGMNASLEKLLQQGAEEVVMKSNPLLLGMYFSSVNDDRAVDAFRQAIFLNENQAASIYSYWAEYLNDKKGDTTQSMIKIRKAFAIDPNNATAFNMWGYTAYNISLKEREKLLRKSIELDPTWAAAWHDLGSALMEDSTRENEAITYLEKSYSMDNTYINPLRSLADIFFLKGRLDEASKTVSRMLYIDPDYRIANMLAIAIAVAEKDTLEAYRTYRKVKHTVSKESLTRYLNSHAYILEQRHNYPLSYRLVNFALAMDSVSESAGYAYSTLAELDGLTGNKVGFYKNIKKAVRLGFDITQPEVSVTEPYKSFLNDQEYKDLLKGIKK